MADAGCGATAGAVIAGEGSTAVMDDVGGSAAVAAALSRAAMRAPSQPPKASKATVPNSAGHSHTGVLRAARAGAGGSSSATSGALSRRRSASDLRRASKIRDIGSIQYAQQVRAGQVVGQRHLGQGAGHAIGGQATGILEDADLRGAGRHFDLPHPQCRVVAIPVRLQQAAVDVDAVLP